MRLLKISCLGLALLGSGCSATSGLDPTGPIRVPEAHGHLVRGPAGTVFSDGLEVLRLGGDEPAVIESVRSVGASETFRFLGAWLAGPDREYASWSQLPGAPPTKRSLGDLEPAADAVLEPDPDGLGYELFLGYEVLRDDVIDTRTRIEVVYRVGDSRHVWTSPAELTYCPRGVGADDCFG